MIYKIEDSISMWYMPLDNMTYNRLFYGFDPVIVTYTLKLAAAWYNDPASDVAIEKAAEEVAKNWYGDAGKDKDVCTEMLQAFDMVASSLAPFIRKRDREIELKKIRSEAGRKGMQSRWGKKAMTTKTTEI